MTIRWVFILRFALAGSLMTDTAQAVERREPRMSEASVQESTLKEKEEPQRDNDKSNRNRDHFVRGQKVLALATKSDGILSMLEEPTFEGRLRAQAFVGDRLEIGDIRSSWLWVEGAEDSGQAGWVGSAEVTVASQPFSEADRRGSRWILRQGVGAAAGLPALPIAAILPGEEDGDVVVLVLPSGDERPVSRLDVWPVDEDRPVSEVLEEMERLARTRPQYRIGGTSAMELDDIGAVYLFFRLAGYPVSMSALVDERWLPGTAIDGDEVRAGDLVNIRRGGLEVLGIVDETARGAIFAPPDRGLTMETFTEAGGVIEAYRILPTTYEETHEEKGEATSTRFWGSNALKVDRAWMLELTLRVATLAFGISTVLLLFGFDPSRKRVLPRTDTRRHGQPRG